MKRTKLTALLCVFFVFSSNCVFGATKKELVRKIIADGIHKTAGFVTKHARKDLILSSFAFGGIAPLFVRILTRNADTNTTRLTGLAFTTCIWSTLVYLNTSLEEESADGHADDDRTLFERNPIAAAIVHSVFALFSYALVDIGFEFFEIFKYFNIFRNSSKTG